MAKPKRYCPGLGETILSSRCGEERGVQIACPDDCEFNPFTQCNYDSFLDLEDRTLIKALQRYRKEVGPLEFQRMMERARARGTDETLGQGDITRFLFLKPLADGRRLAECWEADRWSGLSHDEGRLFRAMAGLRFAVVEVQRQLDDEAVEVIDLLEAAPVPFRLLDRAVTRTWLRFQTLLMWIYEAPHFHRAHGTAMRFEGVGAATPLESLQAIVSHLGGPAKASEAREWIGDHLGEVQASLEASRKAVRHTMLKAMDTRHGRALYRWGKGGSSTRLYLKFRNDPGFERVAATAESRRDGWTGQWDVVERVSKGSDPGVEETLLGQVMVGPQGVEVSTFGGKRYEKLKDRVTRAAGHLIVFDSESFEDPPRQLLEREVSSYDPGLVPPSLLESIDEVELSAFRAPAGETDAVERVNWLMARQYSGYADTPLPALDGLSPREAAADPEKRPALVRLMKQNLYKMDLELAIQGGSYDLLPLVRELGLSEIDFPAPPSGRRLLK